MFRVVKSFLLVLWIALCYCGAWIAYKCRNFTLRDSISCCCFRGILRIVGIHVKVQGAVAAHRPLLLVSNHLSYIDVIVLGSVFPFRFTPKNDVASWPAIGALCRVTDCIFIDRNVEKFQEGFDKIKGVLEAGHVVCLFPEATTGNGTHLLPFKSGLFHLADKPIAGDALAVQPAAIIYRRVNRLPIDSAQWPSIAWYGDMELLPHLWDLLGIGRVDVTLEFLAPTTLSAHEDRKALANYAHDCIDQAIVSSRQEALQIRRKSS